MNPPIDLATLANLIATQAWIGSLISLVMEQVPFIKDPTVANWKKLGAIALLCIVWAIFSTFIHLGGLPTTPDGWYTLVLTAGAVILTNQVAYQLVATVFPNISDWLLLFSGKQPPVTVTSTFVAPNNTNAVG